VKANGELDPIPNEFPSGASETVLLTAWPKRGNTPKVSHWENNAALFCAWRGLLNRSRRVALFGFVVTMARSHAFSSV
jgi:hypothetical protein